MPDLFGIDLNDVDPMGEFTPLPTAEYEVMIQDSDMKVSSKGDNYISLQFVVLDGEYKDRILFENLFLWHANETTQKIAKQKLLAIQMACGFTDNVESSETLHNIPLILKVKYIPDGPNKKGVFEEAHNKITAFKRIEDKANPASRPSRTPPSTKPNGRDSAPIANMRMDSPPVETYADDEPPWG